MKKIFLFLSLFFVTNAFCMYDPIDEKREFLLTMEGLLSSMLLRNDKEIETYRQAFETVSRGASTDPTLREIYLDTENY